MSLIKNPHLIFSLTARMPSLCLYNCLQLLPPYSSLPLKNNGQQYANKSDRLK